jgi:NitT/TauT family transport system substrate-binding protein
MMFARLAALLLACLATLPAAALDKVRFGTNWLAQPEHGGFYQAVVDGTYARYGLDVTIVQGGPQVNNRLLLINGQLDFYMGGNLIQPFTAAERGQPLMVVAALFQKDPQILMVHPDSPFQTLPDLKQATLFLSQLTVASSFQWMKSEWGFRDAQVRPYAFSPAPFLADKNAAQQGYVTSEPFTIERVGGFKPRVFLLADYGFGSYTTTIETRRDMTSNQSDLVSRFVNASIEGWANYLHGDNKAANALILKLNPDITPELIDHAIRAMKAYGLVENEDTRTKGIGAMNPERVEKFFNAMVKAGVVKPGTDWRSVFSFDYVNRGVALKAR